MSDELSRTFLGSGPAGFGVSPVMGSVLTAWDPVTYANTVSDGAYKYTDCLVLNPAQLVLGRVLLLFTPAGPVILGNSYQRQTTTTGGGTGGTGGTGGSAGGTGGGGTPSSANPVDMVDTLDVAFTGSNGKASTYHRFAAGLPHDQAIGLVVHLHGDGAFEYDNPTSVYMLGGTSGIVRQAKARKMLCIAPLSPDTTGEVTWWEAGAANSVYLRDLITSVYAKYPNIDKGRVWFATYSGGSQQFTEYWMPQFSSTMSGGGAMIFGGGADPGDVSSPVSETLYADALKARFPMIWYTGLDDDGTLEANSPGLYDALSDSQSGRAHYQGKGFTTTLNNPAGVNHHIDETTAGFGPIFGQYLHAKDAASVATGTATRSSSTAATWTGTVTNTPAVTFRLSATAFGTQQGFWEIGAVSLTDRTVSITTAGLTPGTPYFWQLEIGGEVAHGTVLASGSVPGS